MKITATRDITLHKKKSQMHSTYLHNCSEFRIYLWRFEVRFSTSKNHNYIYLYFKRTQEPSSSNSSRYCECCDANENWWVCKCEKKTNNDIISGGGFDCVFLFDALCFFNSFKLVYRTIRLGLFWHVDNENVL